ncbi:hypothetical protein Q9L58_006266 [Maublancomyces gigas]|uniref:Uncharacterized protein n=1 Tax=Discina gigas TaxID=1032678 RepID=A0ABR3GG48_9PEZI
MEAASAGPPITTSQATTTPAASPTAFSPTASRTPANTYTSHPETFASLDEEDIQHPVRPNGTLFNMLVIARCDHLSGKLGEARERYEDLLPVAEVERGRDDPVTLSILDSLVEIYNAQGDREAVLRLVGMRMIGNMFG